MSNTHEAKVIRIGEVRPHPNADKLELTNINGPEGFQMVIGKGQYKTGDLAVFVQPETIVPQTEPFKFLWASFLAEEDKCKHTAPEGQTVVVTDKGNEFCLRCQATLINGETSIPERRRLIRPKRLRGEWSEGLLMPVTAFPCPALFNQTGVLCVDEGEDVADLLGLKHYVPEFDRESTVADTAARPKRRYPRTLKGWFFWSLMKLGLRGASKNFAREVAFDSPYYDIDALKGARYGFKLGEQVQVTEKIHGSNARYVFVDGEFYVGSHGQWKRDGGNIWWNVTRQYPQIEKWCRENPGRFLFGEVGPTQKGFHYGCKDGETFFYAFDVYTPYDHKSFARDVPTPRRTWSWAGNEGVTPTAPIIYVGPYDPEHIKTLVDGLTVTGDKHIREGIVIRSLETGRKLKLKSNKFLELAGNR